MPPKIVDVPEHFWSYVTRPDALSCWTWNGGRDDFGYGRVFKSTYGTKFAHRFAYMSVYGKIPGGLEIDHLCGCRGCVNPIHLEVVTHAENVRRAVPANTRKVACISGHLFNADNVYHSISRGKVIRQCRVCRARNVANYRARKAANV